MTRLQAFAERVFSQVLNKADCHCAGSSSDARAVLEREVREFIAKAADQYVGAAMTEVYCNEPENNS